MIGTSVLLVCSDAFQADPKGNKGFSLGPHTIDRVELRKSISSEIIFIYVHIFINICTSQNRNFFLLFLSALAFSMINITCFSLLKIILKFYLFQKKNFFFSEFLFLFTSTIEHFVRYLTAVAKILKIEQMINMVQIITGGNHSQR